MNPFAKSQPRRNDPALWAAIILLGIANPAQAQSTAFTYNGRLNLNGVPVNGAHEMRFTLYDASAGVNVVAGPLPPISADVVNGLFTVRIDFGAGVFTGPARWLSVEVRPVGGAYTILTPRQEVLSSPYSIRAQTAGSVADSSVAVDQLATGGIPPAPGQFLSYDGTNLNWSDPGLGGGAVWSRNGTDAYFNNGNVGIGTMSPRTPLEVNGVLRSTRLGNAEQYLQLDGGDPASIRMTAHSIPAAEKSLVIQNLSGETTPGANNSIQFALGTTASSFTKMVITKDGNVGIGTTDPFAGNRLHVAGAALIEPGGSGGGFIAFHTPDTETGLTISGNGSKRADIRFDGTTLKLLAADSAGPPSSANGIAINTSGNVGIGTTTPVAKLHAETGAADTAAVYGKATGSGGVGMYGQSGGGAAVHAEGNATQARDKGGFVKAMAYIDPFLPADQYVVRCYNSQANGPAASTPNCGFTVTRINPGWYQINFGFNVADRFISLTPQASPFDADFQSTLISLYVTSVLGSTVDVSAVELSASDERQSVDTRFHIIVY
jgi:hypothetical protein